MQADMVFMLVCMAKAHPSAEFFHWCVFICLHVFACVFAQRTQLRPQAASLNAELDYWAISLGICQKRKS